MENVPSTLPRIRAVLRLSFSQRPCREADIAMPIHDIACLVDDRGNRLGGAHFRPLSFAIRPAW